MDKLLNRIIDENKKYTKFGRVASYIPELKKANGERVIYKVKVRDLLGRNASRIN